MRLPHIETGTWISGIGHVGLLAWLALGGLFYAAPELPLPGPTDVTLLTEAEFAALTRAPDVPQPDLIETPDAPSAVAPDVAPAPQQPAPSPAPPPEPPQPAPTPLPEPAPALTPSAPPPPPAPRVAPVPQPEPDPSAEVAPDRQDATAEAPSPEDAAPAEEATAPEAATTQIAPETSDAIPQTPPEPITTLSSSPRPPARPNRPRLEPAEAPSEPAADPIADAVAAAVAEAAEPSGAAPSRPNVPVGPPLTAAERDGLRVAVQQCWNVGSLSSEALRTTVTVAVQMERSGQPNIGSIRLIGSEGGSEAAARQAFEAARRAIIRCGSAGFDLPVEKYEQWRDIEMTFNPERMRIR